MAMSSITSYPAPTKTIRVPFRPPGSSYDCETAVYQYGDLSPGKVPLICIHGGPAATAVSLIPIACLSQTHGTTVILYDQLGCGESTRLPESTKGDTNLWNMELFLAELRHILNHLGIERYDLLGHSWGGMIVGSFALTQPRGLRKIVMYSSPASVPMRVAASRRQRSELPEEHRLMLEKTEPKDTSTPEYDAADMVFFQRHLCRVEPLPEAVVKMNELCGEDKVVAATLYGPSPFENAPEAAIGNWDIRSRLSEITDSTVSGGLLLLNGRYDASPDETMVAYWTQPKARIRWITFEQSSHMAHFEEPERFLEVLGSFLQMQ